MVANRNETWGGGRTLAHVAKERESRHMAGIELTPGVCRYCGCTDALGCAEGCWWIDEEHTVCSARACFTKYFADAGETVGTMIGELAAEAD